MAEHTLADENAADVSATFDLLSDARRRGVLYAVDRGETATVDELARTIASWQADGDGDADPDPERVRLSLVHSHLPKLADADVIDYDRGDGTVALADGAADLDLYLECVQESEKSLSGVRRTAGLA